MVTGWKRAFCTSIPRETEASLSAEQRKGQHCKSSNNSPRISSKFGFFSNPSTPRLQSQPVSSASLRCRTVATTPSTPTSSVPNSPKLQSKTTTPKQSNPSSPKSSSTFSFLKNSLRLSKNRCGICAQSVRTGQGSAIFTAECNHLFHFPCVAAQLKKQPLLICPICNATWKALPLLSVNRPTPKPAETPIVSNSNNSTNTNCNKHLKLRVYNDDEPLVSSSPGSLFNPIPELEENDAEEDQEFRGFFCNQSPAKPVNQVLPNARNMEVSLSPDSAVVSVGRGYETHVVVLTVRAPPSLSTRRRAPIDLVAVLDVSERMSGVRTQMVKRAMRMVLSLLNSMDRLSIVAFSGVSKRLLPLRRMTPSGRRSARRIVDAIGSTNSKGVMSANAALKKAAKVIEERREKNPVSTILVLSNGQDDRSHWDSFDQKRSSPVVSITRYNHLDIPVHSIGFGEISTYNHSQAEDMFAKCLGGILNVVVQDVKLQLGLISGSAPAEVSVVYSAPSRPGVFGPASVRVGDLHGGEEREFLVGLKMSTSPVGSHHALSLRSSFKDPGSQELILSNEQALRLPRAQAVRSSLPHIRRLRDVYVSTRALAESRRSMEHGDLTGAYQLLSSARALLMQSNGDGKAGECLLRLEAEFAEVHRRSQSHNQKGSGEQGEEKSEPLTPTSAWRAAERLAKVAIMRKHMSRVGDLHGFEYARF